MGPHDGILGNPCVSASPILQFTLLGSNQVQDHALLANAASNGMKPYTVETVNFIAALANLATTAAGSGMQLPGHTGNTIAVLNADYLSFVLSFG